MNIKDFKYSQARTYYILKNIKLVCKCMAVLNLELIALHRLLAYEYSACHRMSLEYSLGENQIRNGFIHRLKQVRE
jgi:hypothetical protein